MVAQCPVGPAEHSQATRRKDTTRETLEVRSAVQIFPDLLGSLANLPAVRPELGYAIATLSAMTPSQCWMFDLLGLGPQLTPSLATPQEAHLQPAPPIS